MSNNVLLVDCKHGKRVACVVCTHHLNAVDPVGFIENSSDPNDLQAWCYACEHYFLQQGKMTRKFKKFTNLRIVCDKCYKKIKKLHTVK